MRLYEISEEILNMMQEIEDMGGDEQVLQDTLEASGLQEDFEEKASNIIGLIKNLKAESAVYKEESQRLREESDKLNKKAEGVKKYLDYWMTKLDKTSIQHGVHKAKYHKGREVVDVDLEQLPPEYYTPAEPKPLGKTELKKLLDSGHQVPGVRLVQNPRTLQIK